MTPAQQKYEEARQLMGQGKDKLSAARDSFREAEKSGYDKLAARTGVIQCDVLLHDDSSFRDDFKSLLAMKTTEAKAEAHYWLGQKEWRDENYMAARAAFDVAIGYKHPAAGTALITMQKEME